LLLPALTFSESLYSPSWGFLIDLPEGYEYTDGNDRDRYSFSGPGGAMFDIVVYNGVYRTMKELVDDVNRRLNNSGEFDFFEYNGRQAAIIRLNFNRFNGWGFCVELSSSGGAALPMLLALAYGPAGMDELELFHVSALDSICPSREERYYPGPLIEYSYPRGGSKPVTLKNGITASIRENDEEAAQVLIEREFLILTNYIDTQYWKEAWLRYYRFVYRDSWNRILNPVSALVNNLGGRNAGNDETKRAFAQKALSFVQGFNYERNLTESDFINLVTAVVDGVGDCDSRSMLWAIILAQADIHSAIMVSPYYNHAMGLAEIGGAGARFQADGIGWLVAETTDKVDIGLIGQDLSDPQYWIGVLFN